jgi:hypothetical protein
MFPELVLHSFAGDKLPKLSQMHDSEILLNPNELVRFLKKPAAEFTRHDIVDLLRRKELRCLISVIQPKMES